MLMIIEILSNVLLNFVLRRYILGVPKLQLSQRVVILNLFYQIFKTPL